MPIKIYNGKILLDTSKIAIDDNCCCPGDEVYTCGTPCVDPIFPYMSVTIAGVTGDACCSKANNTFVTSVTSIGAGPTYDCGMTGSVNWPGSHPNNWCSPISGHGVSWGITYLTATDTVTVTGQLHSGGFVLASYSATLSGRSLYLFCIGGSITMPASPGSTDAWCNYTATTMTLSLGLP